MFSMATLLNSIGKHSMATLVSIEELIAAMPGNVYWIDRNNVYQGCNDLQAKSFNLRSRFDVLGKKNSDFFSFAVASILDENNLAVLESGVSKVFEESMIQEDGTRLIASSHKTPLFNKMGDVIGLIGVSFDITTRANFEKKLIKEKDDLGLALENIISNLPGHVYWQDNNNVFLGCNKAQAKSAGLKSTQDIVGKTNYDMPWREQADALNKINYEVMRTGKEYSVEEIAVLSDGKKSFFLSKKVPLVDSSGKTVGIMGISFDITERKEIEAELKRSKEQAEISNQAKTEFLENMRHDIRTPLSGIVSLAEALKNETDKLKINEYAMVMVDASKELLQFLNDVLESINIASGAIPILKKKFNLREILENIIKLHQPKALEKDLKLILKLDEKIPKYLIGDPVRIYRIVLELLVNALKFTSKGQVEVLVKTVEKSNQDVIVQIFVKDTGPGIPFEKQQDLFIQFNRFVPSYEGIYKGHGLGLSIVKQFIDDLQGEIYVDSHLNEGTKFVCVILLKKPLLNEPFDDASVAPEIAFQVRDEKNQKTTIRKNGLVVEDHPIAALAVKTLLEQQNCQIDIAENGELAIGKVKEKQYDFVVMDIGLPDLSGYEVTKIIRNLNLSSQPFIVGLTGHVEIKDQQQAAIFGMDDFLTKPLTQKMAAKLIDDLSNHSSK